MGGGPNHLGDSSLQSSFDAPIGAHPLGALHTNPKPMGLPAPLGPIKVCLLNPTFPYVCVPIGALQTNPEPNGTARTAPIKVCLKPKQFTLKLP
jgi:hypothetical protein